MGSLNMASSYPSSHPSRNAFACKSFLFPSAPVSLCALKFPSVPPNLSSNYSRNRASRIIRAHTKNSAEHETDSSKISHENVAVSTTTSPSTSFLSLLCPLLKLFAGGDPSQERNSSLEVVTSFMSTLARLPWGSRSLVEAHNFATTTLDPPMRLQLFEFEACPFCRRVRESMTELDLSAEVYPCPKGSVRHREMVRRLGGKELFPFLVDPNTGIALYESSEIVKYLFQQYGKGKGPSVGLLESTLFTGWMPTIFRAGRGMTLWEKARPDQPQKMLELFSYENNPYARIVREALCELELPYILQNVGKGSQRTKLLLEACGSNEVPYIVDPNTGAQMGDFKKILSYLYSTYSVATV